MKRILLIILTAALMTALIGCTGGGVSEPDASSAPSSDGDSSSASSEEPSSEAESSAEASEPVEITWPHVTGTFLQPGAFASYSDRQWEIHMSGLLEVGIDTIIIQWTSDTPFGVFLDTYYPSDAAKDNKTSGYAEYPYLLDRCLKAAQKLGVKVFIGLNQSDEWWSTGVQSTDWCKKQADVGIASAKEIYSLYKNEYPDALYGWYFAWEMCNGMGGREKLAGEFLNMYLDPLTELDAAMPLMLSPFVSSGSGSAVKAGQEWTKVFETAEFREGDIFCCQDAVGAGWIKIDQLEDYFKNLKAAVDTEPGLHFWANNENFDQSDWSSAPIGRFVRQMQISDPYVENHITFAYSHYYAKDYDKKAAWHRAYKVYYETGMETSFDLPEPTVTFAAKDDGSVSATLETDQSPAGIYTIVAYGDDGNSVLNKTVMPSMLDRDHLSLTYTLKKSSSYKFVITDYFGNSVEKTFNYGE